MVQKTIRRTRIGTEATTRPLPPLPPETTTTPEPNWIILFIMMILGLAGILLIYFSFDLFNNVDERMKNDKEKKDKDNKDKDKKDEDKEDEDKEDDDIKKKLAYQMLPVGMLILGLVCLAILLSIFYWEFVARKMKTRKMMT